MGRRKTKRQRRDVIALGGAKEAREKVVNIVEVLRETHRRMWRWRIIAATMTMVAAIEGIALLLPYLSKSM